MTAKRQPGMRRVLFSEQSVRRDAEEEKQTLTKVETGDGRVSFQPTLLNGHSSVSLSLERCRAAGPFLVCVRMTGSCYLRAHQHPKAEPQEDSESSAPAVRRARVLLTNNTEGPVLMRKVAKLSAEHPFEKVTLLFVVYDLAPMAARGAGPHLYHARLKDSQHCDVKIAVAGGVELSAHRAVLAARSPVLKKMIAKDAKGSCLELADVSGKAMEKFLEFLYTDHIAAWDCEPELLSLADKLGVPELRTECCVGLYHCDAQRALKLLHVAAADTSDHSHLLDSSLRRRLTNIVVDNMEALAGTKQWAAFKEHHPVLVDVMLGTATPHPDIVSTLTI